MQFWYQTFQTTRGHSSLQYVHMRDQRFSKYILIRICRFEEKTPLQLLSEFLILIGSAMFDATFNLVTRVGLP